MPNPLLAVESLTVDRGGRTILAGLSFELAPGEAILVSGRNGAGKSTLLRALSGLLAVRAGHIVYGLADEERRGIETLHYLGYEDALKPSLTVAENLAFWADMLAAPATPSSGAAGATAMTPAAALAALGIPRLADLPAGYLSAGQKRRVALARLLVVARPLWLLDEPLIALDTAAQALLTSLMAAHLSEGGAILVASHQSLALPHRTIDLAGRVAA